MKNARILRLRLLDSGVWNRCWPYSALVVCTMGCLLALQVLEGVYFQAFPSELHMILGPNGSGKVGCAEHTILGVFRWCKNGFLYNATVVCCHGLP